jgi:uncharacterized membrane protein
MIMIKDLRGRESFSLGFMSALVRHMTAAIFVCLFIVLFERNQKLIIYQSFMNKVYSVQ